MHSSDDFVYLYHIIDYTVMKHDVEYADPVDERKVDEDGGAEYLHTWLARSPLVVMFVRF
jgi:hypothetical protein